MAAGARAVLDAAGSNAGIDITDLGDSTAAQQLLQDLSSGATIDRHASDQIIPFARGIPRPGKTLAVRGGGAPAPRRPRVNDVQ